MEQEEIKNTITGSQQMSQMSGAKVIQALKEIDPSDKLSQEYSEAKAKMENVLNKAQSLAKDLSIKKSNKVEQKQEAPQQTPIQNEQEALQKKEIQNLTSKLEDLKDKHDKGMSQSEAIAKGITIVEAKGAKIDKNMTTNLKAVLNGNVPAKKLAEAINPKPSQSVKQAQNLSHKI